MGVMTINEIRRELDLPHLENGDTSFVQVNVQTLKNATQDKESILAVSEDTDSLFNKKDETQTENSYEGNQKL